MYFYIIYKISPTFNEFLYRLSINTILFTAVRIPIHKIKKREREELGYQAMGVLKTLLLVIVPLAFICYLVQSDQMVN